MTRRPFSGYAVPSPHLPEKDARRSTSVIDIISASLSVRDAPGSISHDPHITAVSLTILFQTGAARPLPKMMGLAK